MALITGASSGIGAEFARQLAARDYDLLLIARREERLQQLADQLHDWHGIQADVLAADLSHTSDVDRVCERIAEMNNLQLVVNNAGFGISEPFATSNLDRQVDMIELHVLASVRLNARSVAGHAGASAWRHHQCLVAGVIRRVAYECQLFGH